MTDKKRPDAEERSAAAELEALLTAAVDAIVTIDERGVITSFNAAAEKMFGYASADVIGVPVTRLMGEPYRSRHQQYLERYLETGEAHIIGLGREVEAVRKSGEVFPISLSVGEAASGSHRRFVGIIRDLTTDRAAEKERRSLEERLAHVGRFSLMGEMAAGIAHEINQPLSAITTYAQAAARLIATDRHDKEALAEACAAIAKQAQRASQVIENLRNFIRKHDVEHRRIDMNRTIKDVLPLIDVDARTAGIAIDADFAADLPQVEADPVQIQQVVLNLTRNAVDAMRGSQAKERGIQITTSRRDGHVEVAVADAGTGVSPRLGDAVFDPFVTTKKEGLGVGLAISRTIVQAHDGTLSFRENPLGGTIFSMSLPVVAEQQEADGEN
ncbi:MAG: PAS domain S-box protein [Gammaproteobacteria bacterium]|nr:PAS domain S-box protein [Gammaproteobacteria bacterium]